MEEAKYLGWEQEEEALEEELPSRIRHRASSGYIILYDTPLEAHREVFLFFYRKKKEGKQKVVPTPFFAT